MFKTMTWQQWLNWAYLELKKSFSPQIDAEIILRKVVNQSRTKLLAFGETKLKNNQIMQLNALIYRRKQGEPIAYLIGSKEFWSLNFKVSTGAFIPRPDTECLIEQVLNLFSVNTYLKVLDLGTGVGTIALSIASERPNWKIIGVDYQKQALKLAHKNKSFLRLNNVQIFYGNWFKSLKKKFDIIVSNPPYIGKHDKCWLIDDMKFEPKNALLSDQSGLQDLILICRNSINHLYPKGWLFLEHAWNQGNIIRSLFKEVGFHHIQTILDYNHFERITYGQWK